MRPHVSRVSPAFGQRVAALAVCVWTVALAASLPETADDAPEGTPSRAVMADWEQIRGDVETDAVRVVYELYVTPERNGVYTVTRYRVTRKVADALGPAREESQKYIWNMARGQPLRCFAREEGGAWRMLAHGSHEYRAEMLTAISVYALHRKARLEG